MPLVCPGCEQPGLPDYQYTYDYASQIYSLDSYLDGLGYAKTYDARGQLGGPGSYDPAGNWVGGTIGENNRFLEDYDTTYSYDNEGNLSRKAGKYSDDVTDYYWDHRNRLTQVRNATRDMAIDGWGSSTGSAIVNAEVTPAEEGSDIVLRLIWNGVETLNGTISVTDMTANLGSDYILDPGNPTATSIPFTIDSQWLFFHLPTMPNTSGETTESFKITVSMYGYDIVLEADIIDLQVTSTVTYAYDPSNQLVRRSLDADGEGNGTATTTFYSHQGGQIALQFDSPTATYPSHRYLWNPAAIDQLLADETVTSSSAGTVKWPLADQVGTIRDIASHDSVTHETTIENHRNYDAFGNLLTETNAAVDELFAYTGRLLDEATGLQWNLHRWYDPKTGRWLSEDPIGFAAGDSNLNRYIANSPVGSSDPSGLKRRGAGSLSIFMQDYGVFVDPDAKPANSDIFSTCAVGLKYAGWYTFFAAGTAAITIQTGGAAGLLPGGAGTYYLGSAGLGAGTVTPGTIGATISAGTGTAAGTAATSQVLIPNNQSFIGWVYQGQVVIASAPNTSHLFLGTQANLVKNGQAIAGATAFTVCKSGGKLHPMGSYNFGGIGSLSPEVIEAIERYFK